MTCVCSLVHLFQVSNSPCSFQTQMFAMNFQLGSHATLSHPNGQPAVETCWTPRLLSVLSPSKLAIFNHRPPTSWLDHVGSIHMFGGCMGLRWRVNCLPCFGGPMNMTTKRQHPTMDTMAVSTSKSRVIYFQCHNFWTWYSHRWVWSTRQRNDIHLAGDVSSYQPGRAQNMYVLWWCSQPIVDAFLFPCVLIPCRWLPYLVYQCIILEPCHALKTQKNCGTNDEALKPLQSEDFFRMKLLEISRWSLCDRNLSVISSGFHAGAKSKFQCCVSICFTITSLYIIYIYIYVCVCVYVCVFNQ